VRYFNQDQIIAGARSALKPALIATMAVTIIVAVVIYGVFSMGGGASGAGAIFLRFIGGVGCLLWALFGLTALARQVHLDMQGQPIPNTKQAMCFAWSRVKPLILLPAWAVGGLLTLLLAELLILLLARIPGIGLVWLALAGVPLLLLNTAVAMALLLALFNIAARVAISQADAGALRDIMWRLLRQRLPELLIYNLGGVLATLFVAALVLSPIWLGLQITWGMAHIIAGPQVFAAQAASGFWGGVAHLVGLITFGGLLAAIASIPAIVITHMTLLVHMELDEPEAGKASAERKKAPAAKKAPVRRPRSTGRSATARKAAGRAPKSAVSRSGKGKAGATGGQDDDSAPAPSKPAPSETA